MTELLIVGGLTIDRFADGRTSPGGSVIHSGRAAVAEGVRPTILTVAGDEPAARDGIADLRSFADVAVQPAASTTTYRHEEAAGRRILVFEAATEPIVAPANPVGASDVLLAAPIADELPTSTIAALRERARPRCTVMLLQGWLRRLALGEPIHPLALDDVAPDAWAAWGAADAVVVSTEDLAEAPEDPFAQAAVLRRHLGPGPLVLVTLGAEGYLLDDPTVDRIVAAMPRRVVEDVPMVGAGDMFGAVLAIRLARGDAPGRAADAATDGVIRVLEGRR